MTSENPYSAPATDPTVVTSYSGEPQLATLSQRFLGAFIDGLITFAVVFPLSLGVGFFWTTSRPTIERPDQIAAAFGGGLLQNVVVQILGFGLFVAIHWKFLNATGQTIGKKVAKTRIVTMAGTKPSMGDLIGKRYAFMNLIGLIPVVGGIVSLIGILLVFRRDRRCLHDLIGGTQVVQVLPGQPIL
jgi:uncharacterized RDD family membrane protein YckC